MSLLIPAQFGALPGGSSAVLMIGAAVFVLIFAVIVGGAIWYAKSGGPEPWEEFAEACQNIVDSEDADAIAFIPYSDGPMIPKPAIYDKELLGGKGGYRTPDGDRLYVDGQGNGKFSLKGVDVILAIDPTEHAAAADPLKAYIAHKNNELGEWVKVDREGTVIEAGEALASMDDIEPAMETSKGDGVAADGGYASEVHRKADDDGMTLEDAKKQLEMNGLLHKIVDVAPPREAVIDETGEINVEEASHVAVDVSSAADLLPKKTNTTDWQTMEEKAKQEGRDEDKMRETMTYGIVLGAAISGIVGGIAMVMMMFM